MFLDHEATAIHTPGSLRSRSCIRFLCLMSYCSISCLKNSSCPSACFPRASLMSLLLLLGLCCSSLIDYFGDLTDDSERSIFLSPMHCINSFQNFLAVLPDLGYCYMERLHRIAQRLMQSWGSARCQFQKSFLSCIGLWQFS